MDTRSPYEMLTPQERDEADAENEADYVVETEHEFSSAEVRNKVWKEIYDKEMAFKELGL